MVETLHIDAAPEERVDLRLVATGWWQEHGGRLLPGEVDGGFSVFGIQFWDGCRFFDYTDGTVFDRVSDLACSPVAGLQSQFVNEHAAEMAYLVWCVASGLEVGEARKLRNLLVRTAPGGVPHSDGRVVEASDCPLGENALDSVSMSFDEWVKSRRSGGEQGSPE